MAKKEKVAEEKTNTKEAETEKKRWEDEIRGNPIPLNKPEFAPREKLIPKTPEKVEEYQKRIMGVNHFDANKDKK